ncbi:glutathione synthase [Marinicella rhabdoformis]|uniref:glutathione synthase n=1 Tax=Marinicella rhabdoformis TaxID=2580566 RepID=UPI0012AEBF34|nr:glutathione synthase [Marinicella rhabdoformis]
MTKSAFIMDPIDSINTSKDSTFAMMLEAQKRQHEIHYITQTDLFCQQGLAQAFSTTIKITDNKHDYYEVLNKQRVNLGEMDYIFMRKDPPFDMEYVMDTYVLDLAERQGARVINRPQALRDANEKFFTEMFPDVTPDNIISRNSNLLKSAIMELGEVIVKPMDGMGGNSIFKTSKDDKNLNVILETVTQNNSRTTMVQRYIKEIAAGDKRILMINGEAVPYALARIPSDQDFRGNLAKGGTGKGLTLSEGDIKICQTVGPLLKNMGIMFAGIDVIGNYLTEVNVTSPTCIRELDALYDLNIAGQLFDCLEETNK